MTHVNPLQALGPVATRETCCKFMMGLSLNFTKLLQRFTLQKPLLTLHKPNVYPEGWHRSTNGTQWYRLCDNMAPLHKICVWTQIRKIKRNLIFNQSESRTMDLRSNANFMQRGHGPCERHTWIVNSPVLVTW